jgi:hypothetical protein
VKEPQRTLKDLEKAKPGSRFRGVYERRQQSSHGGLKNAAFLLAGVLTIGAGIATYPVPVIPSEIVILFGLALLSQGSRHGASLLDGTEVRLRRWFAPALKVWNRWPKWAKIGAGLAWTLSISGLSYWLYRSLAG